MKAYEPLTEPELVRLLRHYAGFLEQRELTIAQGCDQAAKYIERTRNLLESNDMARRASAFNLLCAKARGKAELVDVYRVPERPTEPTDFSKPGPATFSVREVRIYEWRFRAQDTSDFEQAMLGKPK
jgi:hypothetical protein